MENELKQAKREKKTIIPCIDKNLEKFGVRFDKELERWGLNGIQGVEFSNGDDLAEQLKTSILQIMNYRVSYGPPPNGWKGPPDTYKE